MSNITVSGTHTYLVGLDGLVVHNTCGNLNGLLGYNTCGNLDDLAHRFINNFSKAIKKTEIDRWWATGFPKFFKRGTFFEKLMARSAKYSRNLGWTHTSHTQDVIDFFKKSGNKYEVVSMKTTYQETVSQWMSSNSVHLTKLNDLKKSGYQTTNQFKKLESYTYMLRTIILVTTVVGLLRLKRNIKILMLSFRLLRRNSIFNHLVWQV